MAAYHVDSDRITAVPLAPAPTFKPQSPAHIQAIKQKHNLPDHYVLYLGINKPHKNLPALIRAWQLVCQQITAPPLWSLQARGTNATLKRKRLPKNSV
ncbi:MAG: hypothetical protein M5U34_11450 [Chloroflexi bacterium]|nr:hypothetical protein [Chloroflexota bacterium]